MKVQLLAIDCQNDFSNPKGSLFVPGADQDMDRLSRFIGRLEKKLDKIHVTLDSHKVMQVFHSAFWVNSKNEHPTPFTIISVDDVTKGVWQTTIIGLRIRGQEYVETLAARGRYPLIIWPYHTLIGSWGHALVPSVSDAIIQWEKNRKKMADYCVKGDFFMSEHYGALEAEVPAPEEPNTMLNAGLVKTLQEADVLVIAGEALSHCVKATVEQVAQAFGEENIKKFVLLEDCCSSVGGFDKLGKDFVNDMVKRGMRVEKSTEYLA